MLRSAFDRSHRPHIYGLVLTMPLTRLGRQVCADRPKPEPIYKYDRGTMPLDNRSQASWLDIGTDFGGPIKLNLCVVYREDMEM